MKFNDELISRVNAPTPTFFKTVRRVALTLGAIGTALLTAPVALPAAVTTVAGYLVAAGLVATAVSSAAVADVPERQAGAGPGSGVQQGSAGAAAGDEIAGGRPAAPHGVDGSAAAGGSTPGKGDRP